jgi:hypothetical protein
MNNYYSDNNWINFTVEFNWTYANSTTVTGSNSCTTGSIPYSVTTVQNSDDTITITFDGGGTSKQVYLVKNKNINPATVTATLVSNGSFVAANQGYLPVFTFGRQ